MPTLWITSRQTKASLVSERIEITPVSESSELEESRSIPLIDVELVVIGHDTKISAPLIRQLMKRKIPIVFLDYTSQVIGQFLPPPSPRGNTRVRQYELATKLDETIPGIITPLIAAKIYNQRRTIQRLALNRSLSEKFAFLYRRFGSLMERLHHPVNAHPDKILGLEGTASADFYSAWATFLPEDSPFERRSRRPPLNPVNACISFGSTLIYHEMLAACFAAGLDPALGHLHATTDKRWSLALDFVEPFRPVIVEALTLDLFSRTILGADHFEPHEGGVYLNSDGRRKFILQYEKRLERYFHSEHLGHRSNLRQIMRGTPLQYKNHITEGAEFSPFRMN